ncbi:MAG TPA: hypothetical protein VG940_07775 [Gemmatimonadales bacterium]|nr:hypothetical protein [Gemmatimonadales bacterium]
MRRAFRTAACAVALVAMAGCAQTFDATTLGVPATLAADNVAAPQGTAFKVDAKALWAAWGLVPVNQPLLRKALASQLVGGRSIANVRISTHTSIFDGIVSLATLGVLVPRSVTFEGVVVDTPTP